MKKMMKSKIAAAFAAAVMAVCAAVTPASATHGDSGTSQREAFTTPYQTYWKACEQYKFPAGKYWNGGNPESYTNTPCNGHAHDNYYQHDYIYSKGFTSFIGSVNGYQCYGFAQKLQSDFYGVTAGAWIRLTDTAGRQLRVGDHLRINGYKHSVFVTEVNGNTLKFADCNAGGTCVIRWDVNATVNNGVLSYNGLTRVIDWIERPIMQGDVNGDSVIDWLDINDIVSLYRGLYNFSGKQKNPIMEAADLNNDRHVTVQDYFEAYSRLSSNGYFGDKRFLSTVGHW